MAVRIGRLSDSALIARRIAPSRAAFCCSPGYAKRAGLPKTPADLAHHACLVYTGTPRSDQWQVSVEGIWVSVPVSGPLHSNNGDLLLRAAIAGHGIAMLPSFIAGPALAAGTLLRVLPDNTPQEGAIYAIYPQSRQLPRKVRAFSDFLADRIGKEPYWDRA
jgi:DNA-binding transcriptional LysR family regulator